MRSTLTLAAAGALVLALAAACSAPHCPAPPAPARLDAAPARPAAAARPGLGFDPAMTAEERATFAGWYDEGIASLAGFFGPAREEPPEVIACKTDACSLEHAGPSMRSRAFMDPKPHVVIAGIGPIARGTIVHEMIHVAIIRRMGARRRALPTWFDEGVATFVGDNARCAADTKHAIDDLRRLDSTRAWEGLTAMNGKLHPAYCQARAEIAAWVAQHDRASLVGVIDAVTAGRSFDDAYGPILTAGAVEHVLEARFPLDENAGTNAIDTSGRSHMGSLLRGPVWTTGHQGACVKVLDGSFVRAEGFADLGLPDGPFTIALWAKPLANAKVLIHMSARADGSHGWCMPLLGHDAMGHLTAQVSFEARPDAFLDAIGPALPLHTWSHVAVTWSALDGVRLYVNGALVASRAPSAPAETHRDAPASPMYLFFGGDNDAHCWTHTVVPGGWNGAIDDLRVFNYALSAAEIAAEK